MSTSISSQIQSLADLLKQTNELISRLDKLSFQPGSEPLDGVGSVRVELAQDIHDSLKALDEELEVLGQEVEDIYPTIDSRSRQSSEREREKARIVAQVVRLGDDLRNSRRAFRRAQLSAKRASEAAKVRERELVFASLQQPTQDESRTTGDSGEVAPDLFASRRKLAQSKQLTKEELEINASSDVTTALRRTHDLLSTELQRSRFAQETFDQSTAALQQLGEQYDTLGSVLGKSRELLGTLLRSQKSDTWYLETAFYILLATLGWLFFRRILYGPFFKLPLFLWNVLLFLLNWVAWKPILLFLQVTGVVTTRSAGARTTPGFAITSQSRPPLIVQQSATGRAPRIDNMAEHMPYKAGGVPAGMGGGNAKKRPEDVLGGQTSEQIGKMAEQSQNQDRQEAKPVVRGDGMVLKDREDEPVNPKKKTFEATNEEQPKQRAKRDEL
ncbi:hypothetical protein K431DRAFT_283051 [Polychaeton citri CBS 116435]|uniref:Sec20 C-terminal domain-containing protein n=1 Tax=Polychaeton citri CBS 116435 TaxID=1314669 RepID=A0A9P4QE29_9PEZI|nr:hypothetical protein K431DRAFT_283051 [Polychaeton citri CBS 116435]